MKTTITMPGYMGKPWEVTGDVMAGLIVHKMGQSWCISHIATGQRIGAGRKLKADTMAIVKKLLAIMPDWSAPTVDKLAESSGMERGAFTDAIRAIAY
jgi:hypothetical protein